MYLFAVIILASSLCITFVEAVDSRELDLFKVVTSAAYIFAFVYIVNH